MTTTYAALRLTSDQIELLDYLLTLWRHVPRVAEDEMRAEQAELLLKQVRAGAASLRLQDLDLIRYIPDETADEYKIRMEALDRARAEHDAERARITEERRQQERMGNQKIKPRKKTAKPKREPFFLPYTSGGQPNSEELAAGLASGEIMDLTDWSPR